MTGVLRLHNPMSALVWLALFVPGHLLGGALGLVLPAAVLVLGGPALFVSPSEWERRAPSRQAAAVFFILFLIDAVAYAYSLAFNGVRTGWPDALALARPLAAGLFSVYLIRHYDDSVGEALERALTGAIWMTVFLFSTGVSGRQLFEPAPFLCYLATLAAIWFVFFSRARLRLAHAAACAVVVLFSAPAAPRPSREALEYFWRSPLFGWGPARLEPMSALGNQYMSWALRDGLLGAGLILVGLAIVAFRLLRASWHDRRRLVGAAVFLGFAAGMLMSGAFLEDFRLFALTAFMIAGMHEARA